MKNCVSKEAIYYIKSLSVNFLYPLVPGKPVNVRAKLEEDNINVLWEEPVNPNGIITKYNVSGNYVYMFFYLFLFFFVVVVFFFFFTALLGAPLMIYNINL